jgi:hypothetical protein
MASATMAEFEGMKDGLALEERRFFYKYNLLPNVIIKSNHL